MVTDATDFAEGEPDPTPAGAMDWVYAQHWPSETPPPWGLGETDVSDAPGEGAG